ncbi:sulfotransferase domain-containing protein [uncultured Desulfobacter sp.]|uniref:sulfotransferase domain-containing protein n=1 Tax=uncultured Desulfobacter sp. TaxID=240139 RepID=UPI0029F480E9|nr:sulfotransferase domain-containing protein [uncultured Desulfobacter sp.]
MDQNNRLPSFFFITGVPKSGTTWMQLLLNTHQNIFCRPEDTFSELLNGLQSFLKGYNNLLDKTNKKTAQQKEIFYYNQDDVLNCFKFLVTQALSKPQTSGQPVIAAGTKDNAIINQAGLYKKLFPEAKFICIVRNPKDIAVSSWFHNLRVETNFHERSGGDLAAWAQTIATNWNTCILNLSHEFKGADNQLIWVRYEDLLLDAIPTMASVFTFIGVPTDRAEVEKVIDQNRFNKLAQGREAGNEDRTSFFRKGVSGDYKNHLTPEIWKEVTRDAHEVMRELRYEP